MKIYTKDPALLKPNVRSRYSANNDYYVFEDGTIYRNYGEFLTKARHTLNNGYYAVNYYSNSKQDIAYVHRLLAETFIPNPDNLEICTFKDGDITNIALNNLEWISNSQLRINLGKERKITRWENAPTCKTCDKKTLNKSIICDTCIQIKKNIVIDNRNKKRASLRIKEIADIDTSILTTKQRNAHNLRSQGMTIQEIARILGVSRQAISVLLIAGRKRHDEIQNTKSKTKGNV